MGGLDCTAATWQQMCTGYVRFQVQRNRVRSRKPAHLQAAKRGDVPAATQSLTEIACQRTNVRPAAMNDNLQMRILEAAGCRCDR